MKDGELPSIWTVHEEEVADNFGISNVVMEDVRELKVLLTLIHAEGVLEIQPVMAMGGMTGQLDIVATLGLMRAKQGGASNEDLVHCESHGRGQRKSSQIQAWEQMRKRKCGAKRSSTPGQAMGRLKKATSLEDFDDTLGGKGSFQERGNDRNPPRDTKATRLASMFDKALGEERLAHGAPRMGNPPCHAVARCLGW